MPKLPSVDLAVLLLYLALTVGCGLWFASRQVGSDRFMSGNRALPGWAVGLSIFGSYISSISFLANPGKAFAANWNALVFSLATPVAALVAIRWFVPYYRRSGAISAYEHLESRFGAWARTYAVVCFLLTQTARTGTVIYLLALAVSPLTGWSVPTIIVITTVLMVVTSIFGGIESAVWIGVMQSAVLVIGPLICLAALVLQVPGGLGAIVRVGAESGKFSLGSLSLDPSQATVWVVLLYGLTINLGNFGIDQSYVQRYLSTRDETEAQKSLWLTACLYVPASAVFFSIGTALFVLNQTRPEVFPASLDPALQPDAVFPAFIAYRLPTGLSGLVLASIFAASLDSSLANMATLTLCDLYRRYLRPLAGERESLRVLRGATMSWGVIAMIAALAMIRIKNVLDLWWDLAGVLSGGMLGLFLLGWLCPRAARRSAMSGVITGLAVILWMTLSTSPAWPDSLRMVRSPFHPLLVAVVGTMTILGVGWVSSLVETESRSGGNPVRPG